MPEELPKKRALVVVFGDVCQSPRMMNHAMSFASANYDVDVIGYTKDHKSLGSEFALINFFKIPLVKFQCSSYLLLHYFIVLLSLTIRSFYFLYLGLFHINRPSVVIVQNPPFLPTLLIAPIIAKYHGSTYIIDWHNFSFSILAMLESKNNLIIKALEKFELFLGQFGHHHLVVSEAMKKWVLKNTDLSDSKVQVVYDRPNYSFHQLNLKDKHEFLTRFFQCLDDAGWGDESHATKIDDRTGDVVMKANNERNQALVVSSTSWTEDEDFELLWQAILNCELQLAKAGPRKTSLFPTILLVITGKGPLRSKYEDLFKSKQLCFFKIKTMWLSNDDYPKLLASADLGICLHTSSSGLDLPMKLVDMMGCGLPVLAYKYNCINELIEDEENGFLFEDSDHLAQMFLEIFHGFPKSSKALKEVSENLSFRPLMPWKGYWDKYVLQKILS